MAAKIISFFTQKGGVGKTTTAHNVAVALTKKGKNVLLIDADAQMNLTASVLGLSDSIEYADANESKWREVCTKYTNIFGYLDWFSKKNINTQPFNLELFDYNPKNSYPNLFEENNRGFLTLLLGYEQIFKLESTLYTVATSTSLQDDDRFFKIQEAIQELTSYRGRNYDYIIIDTSPSASSILNGTLIMMSDYFLSPVMPNFFSLQAVDNFQEIVKNWVKLLDNFRSSPTKRGLKFSPQFLGIVINQAKRFKKEDAREVTIYAEKWREKINSSVATFYSYAIDNNRIIAKNTFSRAFSESSPFIISEICDFTGNLRAISEITGVPIIDLNNSIVNDGVKKLKIGSISIEKKSTSKTDNHYERAFAEACKSYNYIAEGLLKL